MKFETPGPTPALRRARLATATLFFVNGSGLGSWLPHIPDVKIWHGLSDGVLGLALLALAGGAVAALPVAGALTARCGSRPISRLAAIPFCAVLPLPLLGLPNVAPIVFSAAGRFLISRPGSASLRFPPPATAGSLQGLR